MSNPLVRKDIIEFLVRRKFPSMTLAALRNQSQPAASTTLGRLRLHEEMNRYRSELQVLSFEQIHSLYEDESAKALADLQREEEARFFNQPHAAADFDHWSKAEHWSLDEAIALILGKAPEIVSWERIKTLTYSNSPFVKQYARLRDLAERSRVWQKLFDPVFPVIFLEWAADHDIPVPTELSEKVQRIRGRLVDWKKNYDELKSMYDHHTADWRNVAQRQKNLLEVQQGRIAECEAELAAHEATPASEPTKPQSPIERQNMLKVILGMAVAGYSYNPADKRSKIVAEIVSDLERQGLSVSDDTIRRYLKEARDNAGEWQEEST
jgi:hypothetical protein